MDDPPIYTTEDGAHVVFICPLCAYQSDPMTIPADGVVWCMLSTCMEAGYDFRVVGLTEQEVVDAGIVPSSGPLGPAGTAVLIDPATVTIRKASPETGS